MSKDKRYDPRADFEVIKDILHKGRPVKGGMGNMVKGSDFENAMPSLKRMVDKGYLENPEYRKAEEARKAKEAEEAKKAEEAAAKEAEAKKAKEEEEARKAKEAEEAKKAEENKSKAKK